MENKRVRELHEENIVIDSHLDLGGIIYNYRNKGEEKILNKYF